jgi:hypothetical protein
VLDMKMKKSLWKHFNRAMRVRSEVFKHTLVLRHNNQSSHNFSINHATYGMGRTADSGRLGYKWYLNMTKELNTRSVRNLWRTAELTRSQIHDRTLLQLDMADNSKGARKIQLKRGTR